LELPGLRHVQIRFRNGGGLTVPSGSVVIIGTGLAGYGAAREFRKSDPSSPLTLVTADEGTYYSKPQLSAALGSGKSPDQLALKDAAAMAKDLNARILTETRVVDADAEGRTLKLDHGGEIAFGQLVLAVGASARKPPIRLEDGAEIHSVNNLGQYRRLRAAIPAGGRLAILGAGLIGCEFAHDFAQSGYQVTLIGNGPGLLQGLVPGGIGKALLDALVKLGVRFIPDNAIESVSAHAGIAGPWLATLRHGDPIVADAILSAIGFDPELGLARILRLGIGRGVKVDNALRTSNPSIFALGDCAEIGGRWLPFILPINHAARALGLSLAGKESEMVLPVMPVLIKTPAFPLAVVPPPAGSIGEWIESADAVGAKALFQDAQGRLLGFALGGGHYAERAALAKRITMDPAAA
jgi:rubredoxin---NAD+ reductase